MEVLPPLFMMGSRSLIAGTLIYTVGRLRTPGRGDWRHWASATVAGGLLFLGGHGGVAWAQQHVPSGIAAIMLGTVPIWMTLFDWRLGGPAPTRQAAVGMAIGLAGVTLLMNDRGYEGLRGTTDVWPVVVLGGASIAWSAGSIASRRLPSPPSIVRFTGMQLLGGGAVLMAVSLVSGDAARLDVGALTTRAVLAYAYMLVAGSLIAFMAYTWLLRVSTPTLVGSYAFVTPAVAVFVGWAFGDEVLHPSTWIAVAVILTGVALVVTGRRITSPRPAPTRR